MKHPPSPLAVYARSTVAIILPALVLLLSRTPFGNAMWDIIVERLVLSGIALIVGGVLIILEIGYLTILSRLVRAHGRVSVLRAWETDPAELARRRLCRFRLAAIALSILAAFGFCELIFRVLNIRPPSADRDWVTVDNTLNRLGIRERWDSISDDDRRLRVAFLGDSMTYGDGVEASDAFPRLVQEILSDTPPAGILTINLGFRGTAPGRQLDEYLQLRDVLTPDVVVQVVYPNDLGINFHYSLYDIYRFRDDLWVGEWSYVLRYAERQIRYWMVWRRTIDYFRGGRDSAERAAAWATFRTDMAACKSAVEQTGAAYSLVFFPWLVRLDDNLLPDVHNTMREFALQIGVPYLDLLEVFAGRDAETLRVSLANEHPNALGHRLAAERIARFLRDEVLPLLDR